MSMVKKFEYSFVDMLNNLKTGREIEFEYSGKLYGIFNRDGKWFFFADNQDELLCQFEETNTLLEKVKSLSVQGKTLVEVFNEKLYTQNTLCIF